MTWVKLDDHFADHPKIVGLSSDAFRAFVHGLCYCSRHLTDGHIPQAAVPGVAKRKAAAELLDVGLWEQNGAGVIVHDYLEFQPAKAEVESVRQIRAEAGRRGGQRSGEARRQAKEEQQ